jgi:hypothetical protein
VPEEAVNDYIRRSTEPATQDQDKGDDKNKDSDKGADAAD